VSHLKKKAKLNFAKSLRNPIPQEQHAIGKKVNKVTDKSSYWQLHTNYVTNCTWCFFISTQSICCHGKVGNPKVSVSSSVLVGLEFYSILDNVAFSPATQGKGAARGGAEEAPAPPLVIRILMFVFLVFHQHCKSRWGALQNVLQRYHKA